MHYSTWWVFTDKGEFTVSNRIPGFPRKINSPLFHLGQDKLYCRKGSVQRKLRWVKNSVNP